MMASSNAFYRTRSFLSMSCRSSVRLLDRELRISMKVRAQHLTNLIKVAKQLLGTNLNPVNVGA